MVNRSLVGMVVLLVVVACNSPTAAQSPTASSVSVQPGDLPTGMHRCDLSGDIAAYLTKIKANSPANYAKRKTDWETAQKNGAIAEYIAFYTDSSTHCTAIQSKTPDVFSAAFKLTANYVIQFKDESSATKGYATGSMFGFTTDSLKGGGAPVLEGAKTGLGPNSIVLSVAIGNTAYYLAVWQYKTFMVLLAILNIADVASGKKAALAENGRIK